MKITVFLIAAILCFTGMAAATEDDSEEDPCCWESCGTKVNEGDVDAVYVLLTAATDSTITPKFAFFDYNIAGGITGAFDDYDSGYIDMDGDGIIDPNIDVRITPWHNVPADDPQFKYPANTKVANDLDQGLPLVVPENQQVLCFIDLEGDGYDIEDPIFIDVDAGTTADDNGIVEIHDIRLTSNGWGYSAYTTVGTYDDDKGETLTLMPDIPGYADQGTFEDLLGYIDDDCSTTWTCPDKLYLQQSKTAPTVTDLDFNGDNFVTIGDLRIYIPPEAIENENWPSCGTKVEEGDIDAVYTLNIPTVDNADGLRIMYYDYNGNGFFDGIDSAYVDIVDIPEANDRVDNGDVRITAHHNVPVGDDDYKYLPNTKVINDLDQGLPLTDPGQANLIKFFDTNNVVDNANYDFADYLYADMDGNFIVSIYDIRLTPREDYGYTAYTTVQPGDLDLFDSWPFLPVGGVDTTPAQLIGYIDDDCSGTWTCSDKLYLEQPIYSDPGIGEGIVTIGDFRLYIPQEAIDNEDWPSCGTKVEQCDVDAVYLLKFTPDIYGAILAFYDYDGDRVFDDRDTLYIDIDGDGNNVVESGDIRLTPWHNVPADDSDFKYPANTKVANDLDLNKPLIPLSVNVTSFDINGDGVYDLGDPLYIDTRAPFGQVSLFDVRLTSTAGYDAYTTVRAGDLDLLENRPLEDLGPIGTLIGYIDSDCSDDWTCVDKLYLKQAFQDINDNTGVEIEGLIGAVTIGDFRLYIPPGEIYEDDEPEFWEQYDTNSTDGEINDDEVLTALEDYFTSGSEMTDDQILNVLGKYFS